MQRPAIAEKSCVENSCGFASLRNPFTVSRHARVSRTLPHAWWPGENQLDEELVARAHRERAEDARTSLTYWYEVDPIVTVGTEIAQRAPPRPFWCGTSRQSCW